MVARRANQDMGSKAISVTTKRTLYSLSDRTKNSMAAIAMSLIWNRSLALEAFRNHSSRRSPT
jgi:hypothetical protein